MLARADHGCVSAETLQRVMQVADASLAGASDLDLIASQHRRS